MLFSRYPAFDAFVIGVGTNRLLRTDPHFNDGVDALWTSLDACAGTKVDRNNPDFAPYMDRANLPGPNAVCWWTDKSPHTFEGIMLQVGDTLVKQGNVAAAKIIYANAQRSPDYSNWAFRGMLEDHLANADARAPGYVNATSIADEPEMVGNSIGACSSCHQR